MDCKSKKVVVFGYFEVLVCGIICRELTVGWVGGRRVRVSLRLILLMSQPSKIKSFFCL